MTSDTGYKIMQFIINKEQNGYLAPDDFNLVINQGSRAFLDWLLGEFQQYQYQRPQPRVQYSQNRTIRQSLTPLIYRYVLSIDPNGVSAYPGDFEEVDAMWTIYRYERIRFAQQQQLHSYLNSEINPVTTNPVFLIEDIGFQFYPNISYNSVDLANARLSYVRTPPSIVWAYTLDANGLPVYNPANSVDFWCYEADCMDIIGRALRLVGVNLQADQVSQYANEVKEAGQ